MRENPTVSLVDIEPDRLKGNERFTPERQKQRDKATERLFQYWRGDLHTH